MSREEHPANQEETMPVAAATKPNDQAIWRPCGKCGGKGFITGLDHVAGGVCFACMGDKGTWTTVGKEKARKARAKRAAQKERDRAHAWWENEVRKYKAAGLTYEDRHRDTCLCGNPEGCSPEAKAQFDAVI